MSPLDPSVLDAIRRALDSDPRNTSLWAHYGDLLVEAGSKEPALDAFRNALAGDAGNVRIGRRLVTLLRECGQLSEALIRAEALLAQGRDPALELELARVLLARGDAARAREHSNAARDSETTLTKDALERAFEQGSRQCAQRRAQE